MKMIPMNTAEAIMERRLLLRASSLGYQCEET